MQARVATGLLVLAASAAHVLTVHAWKAVSVEDFGAKGDNLTDNTVAFRAALAAVKASGGEVLVPGGKLSVYRTAPVNLTSNGVTNVC